MFKSMTSAEERNVFDKTFHRTFWIRHIYIQAEGQGSNPSKCQILNLLRCVFSSLLPLRSVGRSNFDNGLHNLMSIKINDIKIVKIKLLCIYIYVCESLIGNSNVYVVFC